MAKNTEQILVRLPLNLKARVDLAAEDTMMTTAAVCRVLIKQQLDVWDEEAERAHRARRGQVLDTPKLPRAERRRLERERRKGPG
jgi:predicted DNA-binding protein